MTEGERAFYKRRIREELIKANAPENQHIRKLHLRWALLYQERLDGVPRNVVRALEAQLRDARLDLEQLDAGQQPNLRVEPLGCGHQHDSGPPKGLEPNGYSVDRHGGAVS